LTHYINVNRKISNSATLAVDIQKAKRWVIIDDSVYSSADSFSAFCKATGWATLVGQATHGDGQGTSAVLISLPNTGLLVRFSGIAAETPDGTLNAVTGIIPDFQINPTIENNRDYLNRLIDDLK
jgi:C-terminal processing protease CtpA/Prc